MNTPNKLFSLLLFFLALVLSPTAGESQVEFLSWEFSGKNGNEALGIGTTASPVAISTTAPSGVLSRGAGLNPDVNPDSFSSTHWGENETFDPASTNYLEFTIAPQVGYLPLLTSLDIHWVSGGNGPQKLSLTSSLDDHATVIETKMIPSSGNSNPYNFSLTGLPSTNETITFRLYGYDANSLAGVGRLEGMGGADLVIRGEFGRCDLTPPGPLEIGCALAPPTGPVGYDPDPEGVKLVIPYATSSGDNDNLMVTAVDGDGNPIVYQFNVDPKGNTISTEDLLEGEGYTITVSDGNCEYTFTGTVNPSACADACEVMLGAYDLLCEDFTTDPGAVSISIPYTGATMGTELATEPMLMNTGDDPEDKTDGTLLLTGATEGETYVVTLFEGTDCATSIVVTVPSDQCETVDNRIFINEVLYDNISDAGNFVEIAVPLSGAFAVDPSLIEVVLYDGAMDMAYASRSLTAGDAGTPSFGYQYYVWEGIDLENGAPDGIALIVEGRVVEFLSYEGIFTAETGPAGGLQSTDIDPQLFGNIDPEPDPIDVSLQRTGDCSAPNISCPDGLTWIKAMATKGAANLGQVLPITLASFTAFAERESVVLEWVTATERDNDYFAIERSADGRSFEGIGRIAGVGSTELETKYGFIDAAPLPGRSYYRLRQVDFDGTTEYFGPVAVDRSGAGTVPVRVYPNPNRTGAITLEGGLRRGTRVSLLDVDGRTLRQWTMEEEQLRRELSITSIIPGVYFLRLEDGRDVRTVRFVRQ